MQASTKFRWPALVAGLLATTGALIILLQDAIRTSVWTTEHALIPVLMAVQILTAHNIAPALRAKRIDSVFLFVVLTLLSTYGVLFMSVTKQSTVASDARARYDHVMAQRAALEPMLVENRKMLANEQKLLAVEARNGCKTLCKGKQVSVQVYENAVRGVEAQIETLGTVSEPQTGAKKMAELISAFTGRDVARVQELVVLTWPFVIASIFEGVALASFGFAVVHRKLLPANDTAASNVEPLATVAAMVPPETVAGNSCRKQLLMPKKRLQTLARKQLPENVVTFAAHPVVTALANVSGPVSNHQLANLMAVSDGEASKRWQEIRQQLDVTRHGREIRIALRQRQSA